MYEFCPDCGAFHSSESDCVLRADDPLIVEAE